MAEVKITVITVCFNAAEFIEATVESVLNQTYKNVEYLVIDGASTDGTLEKLAKYGEKIKLYSEKDFGIYNAMNRGIARASGEFVYFLNAGDTLYDERVLEKVSEKLKCADTIYYGSVEVDIPEGGRKTVDFNDMEGSFMGNIAAGVLPNHQAIFAPVSTLRNHYFRENFKLRADVEWFVYSVCNGIKHEYMGILIAHYDNNGVSSELSNKERMEKETEAIFKEHFYQSGETEANGEEKQSVQDDLAKISRKNIEMAHLMSKWMQLLEHNISVAEYFRKRGFKEIAIYGLGLLGERLLAQLEGTEIAVKYIIDKRASGIGCRYPVIGPEAEFERVDAVVVTAVSDYEAMERIVKAKADYEVICIAKVLGDLKSERIGI